MNEIFDIVVSGVVGLFIFYGIIRFFDDAGLGFLIRKGWRKK